MERTYKTQAIILTRKNFGEADRILTIFTKHYGKLRVRAPGVRRIISRKAPHLELFNLAGLFLVQGKNLDIVTEAETIDNFPRIRKDLKKVSVAYLFCELIDGLCPEKQENREVFSLLIAALKELEVGHDDNIYYQSEIFANKLLQISGYLPKDRILKGDELENFMENILEREIKSKSLLRKIQ